MYNSLRDKQGGMRFASQISALTSRDREREWQVTNANVAWRRARWHAKVCGERATASYLKEAQKRSQKALMPLKASMSVCDSGGTENSILRVSTWSIEKISCSNCELHWSCSSDHTWSILSAIRHSCINIQTSSTHWTVRFYSILVLGRVCFPTEHFWDSKMMDSVNHKFFHCRSARKRLKLRRFSGFHDLFCGRDLQSL